MSEFAQLRNSSTIELRYFSLLIDCFVVISECVKSWSPELFSVALVLLLFVVCGFFNISLERLFGENDTKRLPPLSLLKALLGVAGLSRYLKSRGSFETFSFSFMSGKTKFGGLGFDLSSLNSAALNVSSFS